MKSLLRSSASVIAEPPDYNTLVSSSCKVFMCIIQEETFLDRSIQEMCVFFVFNRSTVAQVCVSTGGSGLASLDTFQKNSKLSLFFKQHSNSISSNLENLDFWFGGAFFGPPGSNDVTTPTNWFFYPSWDASNFNSTLYPRGGNPWLWNNSFPSGNAEYYTTAGATRNPNSCMIVRYNTRSWWEQRACGGSNVSAFVCNPPTPSKRINSSILKRVLLGICLLKIYI